MGRGSRQKFRASYRSWLLGLLGGWLVSVAFAALAQAETRTLTLYNIHTRETLKVTYKRDGKYVPEALKKINWFMRDWRRNLPTKMDPALIDIIWELHRDSGSKKPVYLLSGYRSRKTNEALRRRGGGQAKFSRHILGKAADIHFPDVPVKRLRNLALVKEHGGVGYYPTSALPFIHVDTGRVRHWPRLPRRELAMLFPDRPTRHLPREGRPLTEKDRRYARIRLAALARQKQGAQRRSTPPKKAEPEFALASLMGGFRPPKNLPAKHWRRLWVNTKPKERYAALLGGPSTTASLGQSFTTRVAYAPTPEPSPQEKASPRLAPGLSPEVVARAPVFDEEHPEELFYRPFFLAPFLTDRALAKDTRMAALTPPDLAATASLMGTASREIPLRFRPGAAVVKLMWQHRFAGKAVGGLATDLLAREPSTETRPDGQWLHTAATSQPR